MREKLHRGVEWAQEKLAALASWAVVLSLLWLGLAWMGGIVPPVSELLRYGATGGSVVVISVLVLALVSAATEPKRGA